MKMACFLYFLLVLIGLTSPSYAQKEAARPTLDGITIMADESLIVPLSLIARAYTTEYQIPVSTEFGPSNLQIRSIEEGAEANVFIAAKAIWLRQLEAKGLTDIYSRTPIARNQLVLATAHPVNQQIPLSAGFHAADLIKPGTSLDDLSLSLGDPEYTAEGTYALNSLSHLHLEGEMEPHFMFFRSSHALTDSLRDPSSYGLFFASDARLRPELTVVFPFPENAHSPILYEAVAVAGGNMAGGRHFVDYLTSDKARTIFQRFGFLLPL